LPLPPAHDHTTTCLESDDEVLNALRANLAVGAGLPEPAADRDEALASKERGRKSPSRPWVVRPFKPSSRPPLALLTVFDDGKPEGEVVRLRDGRFVIGRSEGDLIIPHDGMMSSRHVEITRQSVGGQHRWTITDLDSTNGLFFRVLRTVLVDGSEIMLGQGRYRFLAPVKPGAGNAEPADASAKHATRPWGDSDAPVVPTLAEMVGSGLGARFPLTRSEVWLGADPACDICRLKDPCCDAKHARLHRDVKHGWIIENNRSFNGLWFRLPQLVADSSVQFQIGEQRFKLQIGD
jgi:hypothetical protein